LQFVEVVVGLLQRGAVVAGWDGGYSIENTNHSQQRVFKCVLRGCRSMISNMELRGHPHSVAINKNEWYSGKMVQGSILL
jgi:hypothetical protein